MDHPNVIPFASAGTLANGSIGSGVGDFERRHPTSIGRRSKSHPIAAIVAARARCTLDSTRASPPKFRSRDGSITFGEGCIAAIPGLIT
jgi:hypothetical protein